MIGWTLFFLVLTTWILILCASEPRDPDAH